jgi:colanic acid/amylovoran biosynthesis protein
MNIEVIGGGFDNKGAELMTLAVRRYLHSWDPTHRAYLPLNSGTPSARARAGFGAALHFDSTRLDRLNPFLEPVSRLVPAGPRAVASSDIEVVLDISGFVYSDAWGAEHAERHARMFRALRDGGARIVLMPQAFGPFEGKAIRDATRSLLDTASLVFARDPISMGYLEDLGDLPVDVDLAPDFTNLLLPGEQTAKVDPPAPVAVVPNVRLLDKTDAYRAESYVALLRTAIDHLAQTTGVYVLVHETGDSELAVRLAGEARSTVPVVADSDPLVLKRYLGASRFVVGSRYHALVSSLSQGVPTVAIGWSHKYEMLLAEYRQEHNLLSVGSSPAQIRDRLDAVAGSAMDERVLAGLRSDAAEQRRRSEAMWAAVRSATGL